MKKKELSNLKEHELDQIICSIQDIEVQLTLNHPTRKALEEARSKLEGAVQVNRVDRAKKQNSYIYVVESEVPL